MNKDQRDLQREDEIFAEISNDEEDDTSFDAAVMNAVEADGFVQGSIDAEDLSTGFDLTIVTRETTLMRTLKETRYQSLVA